MSRPFVRVVGVALTLGGCAQKLPPIHNNPPPPQTDDVPLPPPPQPTGDAPVAVTSNPPAPLPTWDEVASTHPKGATNPPSPVLVVTQDTQACYKAWMGGMIPPPEEVRQTGGMVVATAQETMGGTAIVCPEGQPATLLAAHDAWLKGGKKGAL